MLSRRSKWAAGVLAVAVAGGIGAGAYAGLPRSAADEPTGSRPVASSPSASTSPSPSASPSASPSPSVPPPVAKPPVVAKPATGPCAQTGPSQLAVERYIAAHPEFGPVTADGKQDATDCAAIKKFQTKYGVRPVAGLAGPTSGKVVARLNKVALAKCSPGATVCLDLTSQTLWVVQNGKIVLGPVPIRSGRPGMATPTGHYRIGNKKKYTVSTIFDVPMPYWQQFNGAMGFHQTPSYLYDNGGGGSHGCVNMLRKDAIALYGLTRVGTKVHVFGRKPGT